MPPLGHSALASQGERRIFPHGLGGYKAGSAHLVWMSEELHPLYFKRLRVVVLDLGLAWEFPVCIPGAQHGSGAACPPLPACTVLCVNFFNLALLSGKFVSPCSSFLPALKKFIGIMSVT